MEGNEPKKVRGSSSKKRDKISTEKELAQFLAANPSSVIDELDGDSGKIVIVRRPWNDPSLVLVLTNKITALAKALNKVLLPETYSGIYHTDTREFEIAWTAFTLSPTMAEVMGRKFSFQHKGKTHECAFQRSSERLLAIAMHSLPIAASTTSFRNMQSFQQYMRKNSSGTIKEGEVKSQYGEPVSFVISEVDWSEIDVMDLVTTLNFYLKHFDLLSPMIIVHSAAKTISVDDLMPRYTDGSFPSRIISNGIDENLLSFWQASTVGDSGRRFVYSFRIIEYASHTYMKATEKLQIKRILSSPTALNNIDKLVDEVVLKVVEVKPSDDVHRFNGLVCDLIKSDVLWRFIEQNRNRFSVDLYMEGGYQIPALISASATEHTFKSGGVLMFSNAIRKIRNHLSHGRDQSTGHMIAPTQANFAKLEPWAGLISLAADEIMLYLHLT